MPYTQLNNLDFSEIKTALKEYMRASQISLTMTLKHLLKSVVGCIGV